MSSKATAAAVAVISNTPEFSKPVDALTVAEQAEAYATAHFIEELAKTRREAVREKLLIEAEKSGTPNEKGGSKLEVNDYTVLRERRLSSSPDEKKLMKLLEQHSLSVESCFDKVTVLQANPSKVAQLVASGHLTEDEAKALYKATYALIVHPSDAFTELMENSVPANAAPAKKSRR